MDDPFQAFIGDMIASKTWETALDNDAKKQLEEDLKNRLMDQIDQAVIEALPEDKIDGLNDLLDRDASEDVIYQYVADSGIDVQRITTQTMMRFRDLYIGTKET